jgi:fatty-acyl-CoA synthase
MKIIVLDENGNFQREARTNEIGVVCIQGPCVFQGYVETEHNRGIWLEGSWFNTGDLGRQDEDGYFWLTGRKKELIIRGGHNIDPATIEEPMYKMPQVKMAAAVGRPDPHAGEVPVVYVEAAEGSGLSREEILDWAGRHIGERAAVPKEAYLVEKIPLTAVGKIFKPALRWDAIRRVYEKELEDLADLLAAKEVSVGEDAVFGTKAVFRVKLQIGTNPETFRRRLAEQLKRYSVAYEAVIC